MHHQLRLLEVAFSSSLAQEYESRKLSAESRVNKWSYASSPRFDPRPHHFDRHGWTPGRTIHQLPEHKSNCAAEGLNEHGQLIAERRYNTISYYESFVAWSESSVEVAHFDYGKDKKPIYLLRIACADGLPAVCYSVAQAGASVEQYTWDDGRLVQVEVHHTSRREGRLGELEFHHTDDLSYRADGRLQHIEVLWPAKPPRTVQTSREVVYERRGSRIYRKP